MRKGHPGMVLVLIVALTLSALGRVVVEDRSYTEGIFKLILAASWTPMPPPMLDEMKKSMISGGQELARASKSANPNDISDQAIPFVSGFHLQDGSRRLLLILFGISSSVVANREELYKANQDRAKWGIDTGRLKNTSKGVSKLDIDGIPCLLQDIETGEGRMQQYSFFIPEYPRMVYQLSIIADDLTTYNKHLDDIAAIINSLKIIRNPAK